MVEGEEGDFKNMSSKNFEFLFQVEEEEEEEKESHLRRLQRQVDGIKKEGSKWRTVSQERKSGGTESENLSVKSLHTHNHTSTHTSTHSLLFKAFTTCGVCPARLAALPRAFECRLECIPLFQTAP